MCIAAELLWYYLDTWSLVWCWCFLSLGGRINLCAASGLRGPNGRSRPQQRPPCVLGNSSACAQGSFSGASWWCHAKHIADVRKQSNTSASMNMWFTLLASCFPKK